MNQAKPKPSSLRPPTDDADLWDLYQQMLRSRLFEQSVQELWEAGKISGEMHMGIGEEAIVAGVVCQLQEGDAMALDHRGTPPLIMRGVDPVLLLRELLGRPDGLCRGMGGHMHLFSRKHLAASSGIVGASGPAGVGFALAAEYLRPGNVAVAFFGEGSVNQGMMMEAMNLAAAMAGLRPVVDLYMVDFMGVAMDALLNHAAKIETFSGGKWKAPLVIRAGCGGGYGDGGQHEQSLWGWLAHIPGLTVVVPSTPADAGGLMLAALEQDGPVIYLEHKLLADYWLEFMGSGGRKTVVYDVPAEGAHGLVPDKWEAVIIGEAVTRREGSDLTMVSVGVGVHRCREAAKALESQGVSVEVIDLRTVSPLDKDTIIDSVGKTERLLVVDEDYRGFGLSGELAAVMLEAGIPIKYGRVCTEETIPYAREREDEVLPNVGRIVRKGEELMREA